MSLNREDHETKRWYYVQKLAQEEYRKISISLMDQDRPVFPSEVEKLDKVMIDLIS